MFIDAQETIQDLRNAIDYLKTHGWIQGYDFDDEGGCCAFGAIRAVVGDDNRAFTCEQARNRASNAARAFYRVTGTDMASYNDTLGRTKDQVINALEIVADALEKDPSRA